ncbi:MAG TPA: Clp protease N-terminal domain-containing protein, partial [Polyangiaceae bacterium]|nr:Clp protease N-terminal domain-containing protein [Polyangiaceae bacterium]
MQLDHFTNKAQEALRIAADEAMRRGNPEVIPEHVLVAVLEQEGGIGRPLFERLGVDVAALTRALGERVEALPRVSGGAQPQLGRRALALLRDAEEEAKQLKDDFISVEHFPLAAARRDKEVQAVFDRYGVAHDRLLRALAEVRGSQRVTDQDPEGKFQALDKYTRDLTALARRGKIDPVIGRDEEIRRV